MSYSLFKQHMRPPIHIIKSYLKKYFGLKKIFFFWGGGGGGGGLSKVGLLAGVLSPVNHKGLYQGWKQTLTAGVK